ncbi:hypothetical protein [Paraburkholderia unamae]|uniref:Uncharacterized protein n=1 Tax=Paraburkholderia unamae TaxID=219649 RepID=A0ACC6RGL1_9BURK
MTPESIVKREVKKVLDEFGIFWWMPTQTRYGINGAPDFVCCWKGRFIGIETKAPGREKNTSSNQDRFHDSIRLAGGMVLVTSSADELREWLTDVGTAWGLI